MTRKKAKAADHEIGGVCVTMTAAQADRWNSGATSERDLDTITVGIPEPQNQARYMTLRRATCERLEPETAREMDGRPANRCGAWK